MPELPQDGQASVEVTSEMIDAGVSAMSGFYSEEFSDDPHRVVVSVYRAMASRHQLLQPQPSAGL